MILGARILVVEDEEIVAGLIQMTLETCQHRVSNVADAESAWQILKSGQDFDAILLDRGLPGMDGIELLRRIKDDAELSHIPVVIETGLDDVDSVREGMAAGAYYYLIKPLQPPLLLSVLEAAIAQYREYAAMQAEVRESGRALAYMTEGTFRYRTLDDAHALARGLARACPDPGRAILGLQELLINAVEHGNLGISYAEKTKLMVDNRWQEEIALRSADPACGARQVLVRLERGAAALSFTIEDEGNGFAWQDYLELSPERAFDPHGRGIAMARMVSFDSIEYLGNGNTVTVTIATPAACKDALRLAA